MKKLIALLLALAMVFALVACGGGKTEPAGGDSTAAAGGLVGVSMPTNDLQRWNQDGANMEKLLKEAGYEVDLQFGANDIPTQVSQIENMISNGAKVLIIAAIDGSSLGTVLAKAKENDVKVIAYDRLIMDSDAVTYYATFDNWLVGVKQGEYIRDALKLDSEAGPFNIEYITGDPGDNNINFFFDGAMSVLQPYVDAGKLVTPSGQTAKMDVATANWATDAAQSRFENILSSFYADKQLDAVLASNDSTAQGVANALASSYDASKKYPVITGQDCDIASTKNMRAGKQAMSVFKDTRDLAAKAVEMVDAIMQGKEPPINDKETYNNGTGIIPSYLCEPVGCTVDNYKDLLITSGYYTLEQLGIEGETAAPAPAEEVELIVFAAASMTETLTEIKALYEAANPGVTITYNFDSSGTLKTQIQEGADCDLFISAAPKQMNALDVSKAGTDANADGLDFVLQGSRINLLENKVALVVPEGNPKGVESFDQLVELLKAGDILFAMGNSDVPVGQYTQKIFAFYGLDEAALAKAGVLTYGSNVKEVTTAVSEATADCGIIYATDAFSAGLTPVDTATAEMCGHVIYPAAVLNISQHQAEAQAFLDYLTGPEASAVFEAVGFTALNK